MANRVDSQIRKNSWNWTPRLQAALPLAVAVAVLLAATGCQNVTGGPPRPRHPELLPTNGVPAEGNKVSLPDYVIEPPDILLIDAVKIIPKSPYRVQPLDLLQIFVDGAFVDQPIAGVYPVEPSGTVNLGPAYGRVSVSDKTLEEATKAIEEHLKQTLNEPQVSISLAQAAGVQQIVGEHLVGPDGKVNLGRYGTVYVTGMTLKGAREAIEAHLSTYLDSPEVALDILSYNSKVFYIITEGAGFGDQVVRIPITGNETVLDAIAQIRGLTRVSSKKIWIARPAPGQTCDQILPVNWTDITRGASTLTNYQVLPGDRIFIAEDRFIKADSTLSKILTPVERLFGFTLLGTQTVQTVNRLPNGNRFNN